MKKEILLIMIAIIIAGGLISAGVYFGLTNQNKYTIEPVNMTNNINTSNTTVNITNDT